MTHNGRYFFDQVSDGCNNFQSGTNQNQTNKSLGGTNLTKEGEDRHYHRFAGVTSEMLLVPGVPPWLIYSARNYRNQSS